VNEPDQRPEQHGAKPVITPTTIASSDNRNSPSRNGRRSFIGSQRTKGARICQSWRMEPKSHVEPPAFSPTRIVVSLTKLCGGTGRL